MSTAGIRINQPFLNDSLTVGGSLAEALVGDSHLINWYQADARSLTLEGAEIVSFNDKKPTGSKYTRNSGSNSATLVNALFGIYPGAKFNPAESDKSVFSGTTPNLAVPFSWAGVATLAGNTASGTLFGTFTSSTVRSILRVGVGTTALQFQYGTTQTAALPVTLGQPFAFAAGSDGTNLFLKVNGAESIVPVAGAPGSSTMALGGLTSGGQFWDGNVSDIFVCDLALNAADAANQALLRKIRNFTQTVYGVST